MEFDRLLSAAADYGFPHARQLVSSGPYGRQNRKAECQYRHLNPCAAGKTCDAISICTAVNSIYKQKYTKD